MPVSHRKAQTRYHRASLQSGFTVIEMVSVIVLLGILSAGATLFIGDSVRIYNDSARRGELTQQGRFIVERINRELRNALPGSVRASNNGATHCLEFTPIVAASSYLGNLAATAVDEVEIVEHSDITVGSFNGYQAVIYAVDNNGVYNSASQSLASIDTIAASITNQLTVDLAATHTYPYDSPYQRLYIINNAVSFCAENGSVTRYSNYSWKNTTQPLPPAGGDSYLIAGHIRLNDSGAVTVFEYTPGVLARTGVVHLDMRFSDDEASGEWVRFSHEVFVRNAP